MIRGEEYLSLSKRLLAATKEGPASSWCDRLAQLYEAAGFDPAQIAWHNSPAHVAFLMIQEAECHYGLDRLRAVLPPEGR